MRIWLVYSLLALYCKKHLLWHCRLWFPKVLIFPGGQNLRISPGFSSKFPKRLSSCFDLKSANVLEVFFKVQRTLLPHHVGRYAGIDVWEQPLFVCLSSLLSIHHFYLTSVFFLVLIYLLPYIQLFQCLLYFCHIIKLFRFPERCTT